MSTVIELGPFAKLSEHLDIEFPPLCCYCLGPATALQEVDIIGPVVKDGAGKTYSPKLRVPYCEKHARETKVNQSILRGLLVSLLLVALAAFIVGHAVLGVKPYSSESLQLLVEVGVLTALLYWAVKLALGLFFRRSLLGTAVFGGGFGIRPKLEPTPQGCKLRIEFTNVVYARHFAELNTTARVLPKMK